MSDRELLALAAKAAGIENLAPPGCAVIVRSDGEGYSCTWNPLFDSRDALELACALGLTVEAGGDNGDVAAYLPGRVRVAAVEWAGMDKAERPAACRRAIVRAAAAIGATGAAS